MSDQPLRLTLVTAPLIEPVSVGEAKLHARIDESADNALVQSLICAARQLAESFTRRVFITQTWNVYLDTWPSETAIELPKAPLQSVTHVKTYDDMDAATVFASSNYFVDTATRPGRIALRNTASWPYPARLTNGIEIQFVAGYGSAPSDVPAQIKQAILLTIAHLYEHRGDASVELPETSCTLLTPHKDWRV